MSESGPTSHTGDDRAPSFGLGRLVMAIFWIFALVSLSLSLWALARAVEVPMGSRLVAVFAGVIYVLVAIGITHNGRRMRIMAWGALIVALVGPLITGLMGIGAPAVPDSFYSAWSAFGADYWFIPLILPVIGLVWMWYSDPRRIVELAEGIERKPVKN